MTSNRYAYSEIFYSIQGEGHYTGVPTAWLRFFTCNLQCNGFGQKDPTDPSTYELPYKDIDASKYRRLKDLPVFDKGCDSSYSWAAKFKHLQQRASVEEIGNKIYAEISNLHNPHGWFVHPKTQQSIHMCFTGGEPLLPHGQKCSSELIRYFRLQSNVPNYVTFETNGTQALTPVFTEAFGNRGVFAGELFFSVSPKLESVTGEKWSKAIKPQVVRQYYNLSNQGQLKFVVRDHDNCWDELDVVVKEFRRAGVHYPVWIMPVGALDDQQLTPATGHIAEMAFERGYNVSARVHTYLFGNKIGT